MARNYGKIVSAFRKTLNECAVHSEALNKKLLKQHAKIYKMECKREEAREELSKTVDFANKLKELIGYKE